VLKTPMIFVTHDQAEALSMADRIVVLSEGRVLQTGTPREIYEQPTSPTVALQLGQPAINLLPVRRADGQWISRDGTPVMAAAGESRAVPDQALLGIRPENIAPYGGTHEGITKIVEYMGPTTTLLVHWAGADIHIVSPRQGAVRPGDKVRPRIDAARAVFFSPGQGE
jgi:multiple sugar transport system ATP-binding protein